jgi:hypothetical protein
MIFIKEKKMDEITISRIEYEDLVNATKKLRALEAAGVDNWEGYDVAMTLLYEEE